jgi:uncharacterized protein DUF6745
MGSCIASAKWGRVRLRSKEENIELQIIRRPDFAGGGVTDEERGKMAAHSALWIERAFRTEPANPQLIEDAINGIYRAANLAAPRVVLVPSPFVMAMAGGTASVWWFLRKKSPLNKQLRKIKQRGVRPYGVTDPATARVIIRATNIAYATKDATRAATHDATRSATNAMIDSATRAAILFAIDDATEAATRAATAGATSSATDDATRAATDDAAKEMTFLAAYFATSAATDAPTSFTTGAVTQNWRDLAASFVGRYWAQAALESATAWGKVYQGGNMWAALECYLTAARDVLGLKLASHAAYAYWEQAAINGGFRWMHPKFCLVSDFPEVLRLDADNRPHAEFGPSHRWRDGWSIWHLNGVRVEQWMAESHPDDMDARRILQVENVDQRRELIRRMGMERIVSQLEPAVLDTERREVGGEYRLLAVEMNHGEPWRFLQMVNQSTGATHIEAVPRECESVRHALNWRASQNINEEWSPAILS